jgi:hypothetical protein
MRKARTSIMEQQGDDMRTFHGIFVAFVIAGSFSACGTTINTVGVSDSSPPAVDLLITSSQNSPHLEVQGRTGATTVLTDNKGRFNNSKYEFSVLATATDQESGIKHIKLIMKRTVCYRTEAGDLAKAYFGTVTRKEVTSTDPRKAPSQVSLGDTGRFDTSLWAIDNPADDNLFVWVNANQRRAVGIGVSTKWSMEAMNFAGATTYSDPINVVAGDLSCGPE